MKSVFYLCVLLLSAVSASAGQGSAGSACAPAKDGKPLQYVDVFDGAPADMAILAPDEATKTQGSWDVGYVYRDGRFVTLRCKYSGGAADDIKIAQPVKSCRYRVGAKNRMSAACD